MGNLLVSFREGWPASFPWQSKMMSFFMPWSGSLPGLGAIGATVAVSSEGWLTLTGDDDGLLKGVAGCGGGIRIFLQFLRMDQEAGWKS